jgi:hypothetical protein
MQINGTPHLDGIKDGHLKTGGSLKDGWSYLMPSDKVLLYEEVTAAFEDELDGHVKEQTNALKNLYLERRGSGSFLIRKDDSGNTHMENTTHDTHKTFTVAPDHKDQNYDVDDDVIGNTMTFFIQRGLQVAACVTYNTETSELSDMVVRPSAMNGNLEKSLIDAVICHAKKEGKTEIFMEESNCDDLCKELGFEIVAGSTDNNGHGMMILQL